MGFGAAVYCNCYKQGLATEPPHEEYVVIDEDGGVNISTDHIENEGTRMEWWLSFDKWAATACSHKDMYYAHERLANISGMGAFRWLVKELGGGLHFPILTKNLPISNCGYLPKQLSNEALKEVMQLKQELTKQANAKDDYGYIIEPLIRVLNASLVTGNPVNWL